MSITSVLDGRCRHLIPKTSRCTRCEHEAMGNVLLAQLAPHLRRKTGTQKEVRVPIELAQSLLSWMSEAPQ